MKKIFVLFFLLVFLIVVFAYNRYTVTDFYNYENMGYDYLVRKPYNEVDFNNNGSVPVSYVDPSNGVSLSFYQFYLIKSDEYIYYIELDPDKFGPHALDCLSEHLAFVPFSFGDMGAVYVFIRESSLVGWEVADDSYSISHGVSGLISQDGFRLCRITTNYGSFASSGDQLIDRAILPAYNFLTGNIQYEFILDKTRTGNSSPYFPFSQGVNSYRSAAAGFYSLFTLRDVGEYDFYTWLTGLQNDIELLGPMPVIPDPDLYSGIDLVSEYFSWVINEIIYVVKFGAVVLRGIR